MTTIALKTNDELRAISSLRRRPEMRLVRAVLERELALARAAYQATISDEGQRGLVDAHKALLDRLFDAELHLGDQK